MIMLASDGPDMGATVRADFALRPGVSFCRTTGRTIFLDLAADRYLCLSPLGEASFSRLIGNDPLTGHDIATLDRLARTGPLSRTGSLSRTGAASPIAPCPTMACPTASLLDEPAPPPRRRDVLLAARSLLGAPLRLRLHGLQTVIAGLRARKAALPLHMDRCRQLAIAAAFARLRTIVDDRDHCLIRSIAVASRLIAARERPELVIAVKLQPFAAHAWVQCAGWLINERADVVRDYTPILVV